MILFRALISIMALSEVLFLHLLHTQYGGGSYTAGTVQRTSLSLIVLDGMYQQDRILQKHLVQEEKIFHFSMQNRIRNKKTLPAITKQSKQSFFFFQKLRFSPA